MSIFSTIKDKIFGHAAAAPAPAAAAPAPSAAAAPDPAPPVTPAPVTDVDVEASLNSLASGSGLNWQTSIVDLLKVVGVDPSFEHRKELAGELGDQGGYSGTAEENIWLHKEVLKALAANGGKVPQNLLA